MYMFNPAADQLEQAAQNLGGFKSNPTESETKAVDYRSQYTKNVMKGNKLT